MIGELWSEGRKSSSLPRVRSLFGVLVRRGGCFEKEEYTAAIETKILAGSVENRRGIFTWSLRSGVRYYIMTH